MKIINLRLVENYIEGKGRISNKKLEKLENDADFMKCVFNKSNDHKLYRLCSNELKMNYDFVKFLVYKFKDNVDFIDTVADHYIQNSNNDMNNFELSIIMKELTKECETVCIKYGLTVEVVSLTDEGILESVKNDLIDDYTKNIYGLGFMYLEHQYEGREIILNNYAKRLIINLYYNNKKELEVELHNKFKTFDNFKEYGTNSYLIDYIARFDYNLSVYVQTRTELLESLNDGLLYLSMRWNSYNKRMNAIRFQQILSVYDEYMDNIKYNLEDNYYELLKYIAKQLNVPDDFYDYVDELLKDENDSFPFKNSLLDKDEESSDSFTQLFETVSSIINEKDPSEIKDIHIPSNKCVVTKIRAKSAEITQL